MKTLVLATLLTAGTMLATPAFAATSTADFVQNASIAGKFEVDSSKLAIDNSSNGNVKAFAKQMITDHTKAGNKLKNVAKAEGKSDSLATDLDQKHADIITKLQGEKGAAFDKDYIAAQKDGHKDAVDLFTDYSKHGDDAALKKFAADTLPTLQMHYAHVKALK